MDELIIDKYYEGLWLFGISAFVMLILTIVVVFIRKHFLNTKHGRGYGIGVIIVILTFTISIFGYSSYELYTYFLDYETVKDEQFESITATLEGYVRINEGNDPNDPIVTGPIFLNKTTGEKIILKVHGYELNVDSVGETYQIIYLPNSRIAVILNE